MNREKGHWTRHSLAVGALIHSRPRVFNYFRRNGIMKKTVDKSVRFVRDEFDTRGRLFFDALWVLSQKNVQDRELYYFHWHEVKSGKPNFRQLERQLHYLYPNKCGYPREKRKEIRDFREKAMIANIGVPTSTENSNYYYIWIQKFFHADVYNHITNMGLESFVGRNIKIMDVNVLHDIAKAEMEEHDENTKRD